MGSSAGFQKKNRWRDADVASRYDERRFRGLLKGRKHRHDVQQVLSLLKRAGGVRKVLDLPCGTGRLLPELTRAGFEVVGGDLSQEMMAGAESWGASGPAARGLIQVDAEVLPFETKAFDALVSLRFLFHVEDRAVRLRILREMARVSRLVIGQVRYRQTAKQGLRWLRSKAGLAPRYRPSNSRSMLAAELAEAGLSLNRVVPVSRLFSDKALFLASCSEEALIGSD